MQPDPQTAVTSILLVDDDPHITRAIAPALEVCGFKVTIVGTGLDAKTQVDAARWDAVVVDLGLPDMDGKSVILHLREKCTTPVVVISAQHSRAEMDAAHAAGANCFLSKPFRSPELIRCIEGLLG